MERLRCWLPWLISIASWHHASRPTIGRGKVEVDSPQCRGGHLSPDLDVAQRRERVARPSASIKAGPMGDEGVRRIERGRPRVICDL